MNPGRIFVPGMRNIGMNQTFGVNPFMGIENITQRKNFFSRIFSGIRAANWNDILGSANKTLNVVNQTIPLIRQAKPMINNVRDMLRLTKIFKQEINKNSDLLKNHYDDNLVKKKEVINNNNLPKFFM